MSSSPYLYEVRDKGGVEIQGQMKVDGFRINTFGKTPEETAAIIRNIKHLKIRDDDIMLCTPPKSGTHWVFEIICMLLNNKAEISPVHKLFLMLANVPDGDLDKLPSPRILNTHVPYDMLPTQMQEKKTKIVVVLRNPKDLVVSAFHHHRGVRMFNYDGKFPDYLPVFMEGDLDYGSWFDYVRGIEQAIIKERDRMHLIYYEDLKENGVEEIKRLAAFLGVLASDDEQLCRDIHDKCNIKIMKAEKIQDPEMVKKVFKNDFSLLRKGIIGDWKNYFTVAENEAFDKFFEEKMQGSNLKFRFEPVSTK